MFDFGGGGFSLGIPVIDSAVRGLLGSTDTIAAAMQASQAPKPPSEDDKKTREQLEEERKKERSRARGGYASTLLTGGRGITEQANTASARLFGT